MLMLATTSSPGSPDARRSLIFWRVPAFSSLQEAEAWSVGRGVESYAFTEAQTVHGEALPSSGQTGTLEGDPR